MAVTGAGCGVSNAESTAEAVAQAVTQATDGLSGQTPAVAFVSTTVARDVAEVQKAFAETLPDGTLVHGITSSGALLTTAGEGAVSQGVGCLLLASDGGSDDFCTAFDAAGDAAKAANALKAQMAAPKAIFMGATPGAEEGILETLASVFPGVPVFGGTAADDALSGEWKVWGGSGEPSGTGVSLVGIGAAVDFGASMLGPYTATSQTVVATKTAGRRVFELDGKPAADWVYAWLGDEVKEQYESGGLVLPQTAQKPIALKVNDDFVTAHCAAFSGQKPAEGDGETYVDFFAPIPQGATLTVMDSGDGPATGYASALSNAYSTAAGAVSSPKAGLLVYCGGMAIAVGDNLNAGLTSAAFVEQAGAVPCLGMTCFGEQACLASSQTNVQRNLSVGMVLFG